MTAPLKPDGTLDIEYINQLPIEEYIEVISSLTDEQYAFFHSNKQVSKSCHHRKGMIVNYTMEDEIERGTGVLLSDFITKLKNELGIL